MNRSRSILFVKPDYHCSFFYREQFRKMGWKADVFVPWSYPEKLLYRSQDVLRPWRINRLFGPLQIIVNHILGIIWWIWVACRYGTHVYYGRAPVFSFLEDSRIAKRLFGEGFSFELSLASALGTVLVYLPTGCHDQETKADFAKFDGGNVCDNCGVWDRCNDRSNHDNFYRVRRYFDINIGFGDFVSSQYPTTDFRWKSIDLQLWRPDLAVPAEHRLPATENLRIMHSNFLKESSRAWQNRNIKGSPFVHAAVQRLKQEGYAVEYFFVEGVRSQDMRFYQVQADIVVEQLIYGWWGSTFVEAAALGKPVVCYLRPTWKERFLDRWDYQELPIVEATTATIYDALKRLVVDERYRADRGTAARRFAEEHFDPAVNARSFADLIIAARR